MNTLTELELNNLRRRMRAVDGAQGREIVVDGRRALNFCSNDYLGLAGDPRLSTAAAACAREEGFGAGASRLVCGNLGAHRRLEERIASFKGAEAALLYSTGYMANLGIISGLFGRDDMIFSDRLNHASIIDGIVLSRAGFKRYPHKDMNALEDLLKNTSCRGQKVIVTDSVFSMDGDIAPLGRIAVLAEKYGCLVMVDEAHGFGVLGKDGRGAVEQFDLEGRIDIQMGTFSKAVGSFGAYCCASKEIIDLLVNRSRSLIYTTGMPPSVAAASLKGIEIIETEPNRRALVLQRARHVRGSLSDAGFETLATETPIIPLVIGDPEATVTFSKKLFDCGIFVAAIRPPTVPEGTARLRVTLTAIHTDDDTEKLLNHLLSIGRELCIL